MTLSDLARRLRASGAARFAERIGALVEDEGRR
jgi:hypothetical protein